MKVVLLARDGPHAWYLARRLHQEGRLDAIVAESGRPARVRKLRRELRGARAWRKLGKLVDFAALACYGRAWKGFLKRRFLEPRSLRDFPDGVLRWAVEDANEPASVMFLQEQAPDVLVVLGTSILRPAVLETARIAALNVHGGLVPGYRNVHSEAWAVLRGEPDHIGTSILHLDEGVDSGAVALQASVDAPPGTGFFERRLLNMELSARLALDALERLERRSLPCVPQAGGAIGFHRTPGWRDLLRLWRAARRMNR